MRRTATIRGQGSGRLLEASLRLVQESVKRFPQSIDDSSLAGGSGHAYIWVQRVTGARKCLLLCRRCLQNSGSPKYCYDNDQGRQSTTGPVIRGKTKQETFAVYKTTPHFGTSRCRWMRAADHPDPRGSARKHRNPHLRFLLRLGRDCVDGRPRALGQSAGETGLR